MSATQEATPAAAQTNGKGTDEVASKRLTAEQSATLLDAAIKTDDKISELIVRTSDLLTEKRLVQSQLQEIRDTLATFVNQDLVTTAQAEWISAHLPKRERK